MMTNELVVTGVPRSGTSYLCSILNKIRNTVVINEPSEVLQILHNESPVPLSHYYNLIRERIKNGQPIANKLVNGEFIEDTNNIDVRTAYIPSVDTPDFLLGTKNTLIYLNTLERLFRDLPEATFIACVRHPYDTIASWSRVSFPHIRNAEPRFLLNYVSGRQKQEIGKILQTPELAERYAMWWNYLAGIITGHSKRLMVVRYEEMVADPHGTLDHICKTASFPPNMQQALKPSSPRHHQNALDSDIIAAIGKYCKESAAFFGYGL